MIIKTLGDFRKLTEHLSDDFNIEMRIVRRLTDEELKKIALYPYPYETKIVNLEFDDIGYSDKDLCLSVKIPNNEEKWKLDSSNASGNGHHGNCKYCNLPLVTDLGYCSWDNTKCIDRELEDPMELNKKQKSYINFNGLRWNKELKKFIRPYTYIEYSIDEIINIVNNFKI